MSTSPLPQDPYEVLGLARTCDIEDVKKAHRKLVLKHHPDRIKDPALVEQNKNEFQKVQQAYELLSDPARRSRYDDKVKLAELRRERMMNDMSSARSTFSTTTYTARAPPSAAPSVRREMRSDGKFYEDRSPDSYYEPRATRDRYDEPPLRATTRKSDSYEKRPSSSRGSEKREREKEKPKSGWDGPIKGMSMKMAFNLKKTAQAAKERTREEHARSAKTRDKEEQRARTEKQAGTRYARVDSESDSDTTTVVPPRRPATRDSKASPRARNVSSPETVKTRPPPPPRSHSYDVEDSDDDTASKWEQHHEDVRAYIAQSQKRPQMGRSASGAHIYWEKDTLKDHRRSGSDSDRRPTSSSKDPRRSAAAEARARPAMPTQNSAPGNLKANIIEREPQRSKTSYNPEAKPMPNLKRAETAPMPKARKDSNLSRGGSNLKHAETMHDSGYGSSSSPHTPEMRGESPPPPRDSKRREKSTKYQIVDPLSDDEGRKPRLNKLHSDDDRPRRHNRSPDGLDERREHRERPSRPRVDTDMRPGSSRATFSPVDGRPIHSSPRDSPGVSRHNSGKLYGERSPDDTYTRRVDPNAVRYASYRTPEDYDNMPGSHFRNPNMGARRPSVY